MDCSVAAGLMPLAGATRCEMSMETTWYTGDLGRTLAFWEGLQDVGVEGGSPGNSLGLLYRLVMVGGVPPTVAPMSWFWASRRHSAA